MTQLLPALILAYAWFLNSLELIIRPIPRELVYVTDLMVGVIGVVVVMRLIARRSWAIIPARYVFVFLAFVWVCLSGVILNGVETSTAIGGARFFFRSVPMFLLPFAFDYSERQIRLALLLLLAGLLVQVPVTIWQRFFEWKRFTGDVIGGTFSSTPVLAILASMGVTFLLAFYLDRRIGLLRFALLSLAIILAPSLAEVKAVPIMLGIGAASVVLVRWQALDKKRFVPLLLTGTLLLATFSGLYSLLYAREDGSGYFDLMTDPDRYYHFKGVEALPFEIPIRKRAAIIGSSDPTTVAADPGEEPLPPGRLDNIRMPMQALLPDQPIYFTFGLGIGNVSSDFGAPGMYQVLATSFFATRVTFSYLLWETGLAGAILFLLFFGMLTRDCMRGAGEPGFNGTLLAGLFGCTGIMFFGLFYVNVFFLAPVIYPFFLFSGYMLRTVSERRISQSTGFTPPAASKERTMVGNGIVH